MELQCYIIAKQLNDFDYSCFRNLIWRTMNFDGKDLRPRPGETTEPHLPLETTELHLLLGTTNESLPFLGTCGRALSCRLQ